VIQSMWDTAETRRSPAEWALDWLWHKPEISSVLSGMSAMQQMVENLASAEHAAVGMLTQPELAIVERVRGAYENLRATSCTSCAYCMPCPNGVDIPRTFLILNSGLMFGNMAEARKAYTRLMRDQSPSILASSCQQCRDCEEQCPQNILISEWMPYAHQILGEGKEYRPEDRPER